jgi:hypothetical protein
LGIVDGSVFVDSRREAERAHALREIPYARYRIHQGRVVRAPPESILHILEVAKLANRHR